MCPVLIQVLRHFLIGKFFIFKYYFFKRLGISFKFYSIRRGLVLWLLELFFKSDLHNLLNLFIRLGVGGDSLCNGSQ